MGAIFRVPYLLSGDLIRDVRRLRSEGIITCAADLRGTAAYDAVDCCAPTAFMIGNEANGLSYELAGEADVRMRIPMEGSVESLNAAMAAVILMFEAARQRRRQPEA